MKIHVATGCKSGIFTMSRAPDQVSKRRDKLESRLENDQILNLSSESGSKSSVLARGEAALPVILRVQIMEMIVQMSKFTPHKVALQPVAKMLPDVAGIFVVW